jgi:hypothetical protein
MELAFELENGLAQGAAQPVRKRALYERNPVMFWQLLCAVLFFALLIALIVDR